MTAAEHAAVVRRSVRPPAQILRANSVLHDLTYAFASLAWLEEQAARTEAAEKERDEAQRVRFQANQMIVVPEDALIRESLRANAAEVLVAQLEADLAHETNALTESTRRVAQLETALDDIETSPEDPLRVQAVARADLAADRETET